MPSSSTPPPTLRPATSADIPAILSLLLTSFRQFPLFAALYTPLSHDLNTTHDTVFFWRRRLLLALLDPGCSVVVAEVPAEQAPALVAREGARGEEAECWRMLDWVVGTAGLSQQSGQMGGGVVVGFAIWRIRGVTRPFGWAAWLKKLAIDLELLFYRKFYTRKDQDTTRYKSYLKAEELLEQRFYPDPCYYLDNLCVDFRCQRMGIGTALAEWGVESARTERLPVGTEAGPMGVGLYRKLGFEEVGVWRVQIPGGQDIEMPVMRLVV